MSVHIAVNCACHNSQCVGPFFCCRASRRRSWSVQRRHTSTTLRTSRFDAWQLRLAVSDESKPHALVTTDSMWLMDPG